MAATLDRQAEASLAAALDARENLLAAQQRNRDERVRFLRDGKAAGWGWARMARAMDLSDAALRRFWREHRMTATRLGEENTHAMVEKDAATATGSGAGRDVGPGGEGTLATASEGQG